MNDLYQYAVHLIYAVLIGQSFSIASKVFVPIENLFNFEGFSHGCALFLVYTIVITGWVGWTKSITKNPHSPNALGNFRFVTDLFILFLFYYLINLTDPDKFVQYGETFTWVFPLIFGTYIIWDLLKYFEYKSDIPQEVKKRKHRLKVTICFFFPFLIQALVYVYVIQTQPFLKWDTSNAWDIVFMSSSFALTIAYRWKKWSVPTATKRRGVRKNNKNKPTK